MNCYLEAERKGLDKDDLKIAVFDLDVVEESELKEAIKIAQDKGVILMTSNLSFELWLLMHFEDKSKAYTQDDYEDRLSVHLGHKYRKSKGLKDKVNDTSIKNAIERGRVRLMDASPQTCLKTPNSSTLWKLMSEIVYGRP